jgi:protein-tyrosine phosphatase
MHQIIPSRLWIGHIGDARDVRNVLNLGVEAVVDLACNELPVEVPRDIIYLRVPIVDGSGNSPEILKLAVETTARLIDCGIASFVYCSVGLSRTPAIVAAAMASANHSDLDESLKMLSERMSHDVLPGLWNEVKAACDESSG